VKITNRRLGKDPESQIKNDFTENALDIKNSIVNMI